MEDRECMAKNSAEEGYFYKNKFSWQNKQSKAIFRGGNTGQNLDEHNRPMQRLKLLDICL